MATENKGVMVYLPKEVEEYITNFCTEYNITRKDKEGNVLPSLGTGVVTYLKSQIAGENPGDILAKPSKVLSTGLTKEEVIDLISEYSTSNSTSNIPNLEAVDKRITANDRSIEDIERVVAKLLRRLEDIELLKTSTDATAVEQLVKAEIEPLADLLAELDTRTQSQFAAVREELKKPTIDILTIEDCNFKRSESTPYKPKNKQPQIELEPSQEPTELTFRQFCEHYGIEVPDGTSNQPSKAIVLPVIAQVESMGHCGWSWKSEIKRLVREV